MEHTESLTKIYYTTDYSLFKFIAGNRDLMQIKVNKLIEDAQNGLDFFQFCPILVNKNMAIIDGQHRFWACRQMKHNVYYVIVPNCTFANISRINNNQNRWKNTDFLNCYSGGGGNSRDYEQMFTFIENYGVSVSLAVGLLQTGEVLQGGGHIVMDNFRNGDFKALFHDQAVVFMEKAREYSDFTTEWNSRAFLLALQKLQSSDKYAQQEVIEKLRKHDLKIERQGNYKEYLSHLEQQFNYKNSIRRTLY